MFIYKVISIYVAVCSVLHFDSFELGQHNKKKKKPISLNIFNVSFHMTPTIKSCFYVVYIDFIKSHIYCTHIYRMENLIDVMMEIFTHFSLFTRLTNEIYQEMLKLFEQRKHVRGIRK